MTNAWRSREIAFAAYLSALRGDRVELPLRGEDLKINEWPVDILARRNK